jgi:phosphoribosylformylglycinamidine synthase
VAREADVSDLAASERDRAQQSRLVEAASNQWVRSAHDCADGGFAVALSECCFSGGGGADVSIAAPRLSDAAPFDGATAALFSESASRAIVSVAAGQTGALLARAAALGVPATVIGRSGGDRIRIAVEGEAVIDCATAEAEQRWKTGLARYFEERVA